MALKAVARRMNIVSSAFFPGTTLIVSLSCLAGRLPAFFFVLCLQRVEFSEGDVSLKNMLSSIDYFDYSCVSRSKWTNYQLSSQFEWSSACDHRLRLNLESDPLGSLRRALYGRHIAPLHGISII